MIDILERLHTEGDRAPLDPDCNVNLLKDAAAEIERLKHELQFKELIHVGFTNGAQIEYAKRDTGMFYPDTEADCWIPLYMLVKHAHREGPDGKTFCYLMKIEKQNRELEQERDQLRLYIDKCIDSSIYGDTKCLATHDAEVIERAREYARDACDSAGTNSADDYDTAIGDYVGEIRASAEDMKL